MQGACKWFDRRKGMGFVTATDGTDYFVHHSNIKAEGFKILYAGQEVTFDLGKDEKERVVAENVVGGTVPEKPPRAKKPEPTSQPAISSRRNRGKGKKSQKFETGENLNAMFPHFATAKELYEHIRALTSQGGDYTVRNFVGVIQDVSVASSTVETELFPRGALDFYTKKNMGWDYSEADSKQWLMPERGGEQGDYRDGMPEKIANVIDCLRTEPRSKRAIIPIPFPSQGSKTVDWKNQGQTKCCRELHFYIEDGKLKCTGMLRMQNASIFPKNIHFFATLIAHVAKELNLPVGEYTHWITNLCHDRSAVSC